jgi:hypothetical protein
MIMLGDALPNVPATRDAAVQVAGDVIGGVEVQVDAFRKGVATPVPLKSKAWILNHSFAL